VQQSATSEAGIRFRVSETVQQPQPTTKTLSFIFPLFEGQSDFDSYLGARTPLRATTPPNGADNAGTFKRLRSPVITVPVLPHQSVSATREAAPPSNSPTSTTTTTRRQFVGARHAPTSDLFNRSFDPVKSLGVCRRRSAARVLPLCQFHPRADQWAGSSGSATRRSTC
jgi:hypothetical protein